MARGGAGRGLDLHVHSTCSDGLDEVEEVVALAARAGLEGLALTDHDTFEGLDRARAAADVHGLELVPGVEFSAELDGWSVHLLGLWVDPAEPVLLAELARLRNERSDRAERIAARLAELGAPVSMARVRELAGSAPIGRPHLAAAVVQAGHATSEREVFDRWLHDGGPAHVPKHAVEPRRAVELLHGAGGVAVLAHPAIRGPEGAPVLTDAVIADLAAAGLDGLEVDHPDHPHPVRDRLRALAARLDLVVTGGSDHHGAVKAQRVGDATTTREAVERLRSRRGRSVSP